MSQQQKDIALIAATDAEMRPVRQRLKLGRVRRLRFVGEVGGQRIIAVVTGVGQQRASALVERLLTQHAIGHIVHLGFAGGLQPGLRTGDLLSVGQITTMGRMPITVDAYRPHTLLTSDQPLLTPARKASAWAQHSADAVDMESHAVAMLCEQSGVRYTPVRAISDPADAALPAGVTNLVKPDGQVDPIGIAAFVAANPLRVGTLADLSRGARIAGQAVVDEVERVLAQG